MREENHLLSLLELDMFLVWNTIIFDSLPMKVSIRNGAVPSTKAVKRPSWIPVSCFRPLGASRPCYVFQRSSGIIPQLNLEQKATIVGEFKDG